MIDEQAQNTLEFASRCKWGARHGSPGLDTRVWEQLDGVMPFLVPFRSQPWATKAGAPE